MLVRTRWIVLGAGLLTLALAPACRDQSNANVPFNEDLGTGGVPLLPTATPALNTKIKEGTAQFVAFRDPKAPPEEGAEGAGGGEEKPVDNARIEQEVRDVVKDYNEAVAKKDFEALAEFYVKGQQEPLKKILEAYKDLGAKLAGIRTSLEEKLPDAKDRIDAAMKDIVHESDVELKISSLTVTSQTEVAAKVQPAGGRDTIHFRLMKDEGGDAFWFMDDPLLKDSSAALAGMAMATTAIGALETGLKGGTMPPDAVLQQLEMMAKAAASARQQTGAQPEPGGENAAEEKPEKPSPG